MNIVRIVLVVLLNVVCGEYIDDVEAAVKEALSYGPEQLKAWMLHPGDGTLFLNDTTVIFDATDLHNNIGMDDDFTKF